MPLEEFTWPLISGGVALVVFSLTLYPQLIKRFGAVTMVRTGLLLGIPATVILPLASLFTSTYLLEQVTVPGGCFSALELELPSFSFNSGLG